MSDSSLTVACQAPLSMGFSRQEYWRGVPFPPPGDLPDPGIKPSTGRWVLYHCATWLSRGSRCQADRQLILNPPLDGAQTLRWGGNTGGKPQPTKLGVILNHCSAKVSPPQKPAFQEGRLHEEQAWERPHYPQRSPKPEGHQMNTQNFR